MHAIERKTFEQLSPREQDTLATRIIKPFTETNAPDDFTSVGQMQQWTHPRDGILFSTPYALNQDNPARQQGLEWGHTWKKFCPTTDLNHAFDLIERDFTMVALVQTPDGTWMVTMFRRSTMQSAGCKAENVDRLPYAVTCAAVMAFTRPASS